MPVSKFKVAVALIALAMLAVPSHVFACAACFGQSDSPQAKSANAGIFTLLAVIVPVLITGAAFFMFLARKAAAAARAEQAQELPAQS